MSKTDLQRYKGRIQRLQRRLAWIEDRAIDLHEGSFDDAEASALRWAIPILEKEVRGIIESNRLSSAASTDAKGGKPDGE